MNTSTKKKHSFIYKITGCFAIWVIFFPGIFWLIINFLNGMKWNIFPFIQLIGGDAFVISYFKIAWVVVLLHILCAFVVSKFNASILSKSIIFSIAPAVVLMMVFPINVILIEVLSEKFVAFMILLIFLISFYMGKKIIFNN